MTRTEKVNKLFELRHGLWREFEAACPGVRGFSWKVPLDDRRIMYWRLADEGKSLVYSNRKVAVTDGEFLDDTFVDTVKAVWRPGREEFVMAFVTTEIGDGDCLAVLWTDLEVAVEPVEDDE